MADVEELILIWREKRPHLTRLRDVEKVLEHYFDGCYERKSGSHIVVKDERLIGLHGGPAGDFTIPVKSGRHVKFVYIKELIKVIEILEELESEQ